MDPIKKLGKSLDKMKQTFAKRPLLCLYAFSYCSKPYVVGTSIDNCLFCEPLKNP